MYEDLEAATIAEIKNCESKLKFFKDQLVRINKFKKIALEDLGFSVRTENALKNYGLTNLYLIAAHGVRRLRYIEYIGVKSMIEIVECFIKYGFFFEKDADIASYYYGKNREIFLKALEGRVEVKAFKKA